ncbi:MAG: M48 family metallopeptidase, partial [Bacteroidota bacterium]
PVWLALAYFGILFVVMDVFGTPFALYHTFVIEERFGFNKTTPKTYVLDKIKGYFMAAILGGGIMFLLIGLINWLAEDFWLWFWLAMTVIVLVMQYFYSIVLLPIFNKLTPLEDGELRQAIEAYAREVNFPLTNVMVMDGSKRSTKANAFFVGFGKNKRIVLYDTLIAQMTVPELVAVLAHEVGHYKRRHVVQGMAISVLNMGVMLFVLSRLVTAPSLSLALGADVPGIHLSLMAFGMLYAPISQVTGILFNLLSRKNEYEADAYAESTYDGKALGSALAKLHVKTLSNLQPHPAYVFVHHSHPTLLQRLAALKVAPAMDSR